MVAAEGQECGGADRGAHLSRRCCPARNQVLDVNLTQATTLLGAQGSTLSEYDQEGQLVRMLAVYTVPLRLPG